MYPFSLSTRKTIATYGVETSQITSVKDNATTMHISISNYKHPNPNSNPNVITLHSNPNPNAQVEKTVGLLIHHHKTHLTSFLLTRMSLFMDLILLLDNSLSRIIPSILLYSRRTTYAPISATFLTLTITTSSTSGYMLS